MARRAAGAAAGSLVGLGIGGPPGALIGAITGPAVTALVEVVEEAARRRLNRWSRTYEHAAELASTTTEELSALLTANDEKLEIALQALTSAGQCTVREKAQALAASIAAVATSETNHEIDAIALVVKALAELDRAHLVLLRLVAEADPDSATPDYLAERSGAAIPILRPVVRLLELHGLIADANRLRPGAVGVIWELTDLGKLCLRLLGRGGGGKEHAR